MKTRKYSTLILSATAATLAVSAAPVAWAKNGLETPFSVADVYAELNDTDGDLGLHALIDGHAWRRLQITTPGERRLLDIKVRGRMRRQGLTQLFFESAEPPFDELAPREFFRRFPEGEYEIEGKTLEGQDLESEDLFWHVMPAQAGLQDDLTVSIQVGGVEDEVLREKCDDEDPAYDPVVVDDDEVTIAWDPVTQAHPTIGEMGTIVVAHYEVFAEVELEDGSQSKFSAKLPSYQTSITLPEEFIELGDTFKYEVLVKEATGGNQTAVESCFRLEDEEERD